MAFGMLENAVSPTMSTLTVSWQLDHTHHLRKHCAFIVAKRKIGWVKPQVNVLLHRNFA